MLSKRWWPCAVSVALAACGEDRVGEPFVEIRDASVTECLEGGKVIVVGQDENGNGTLDDDEVASTDAVCNGVPGAPGRDGRDGDRGLPGSTALIRTVDEPPGLNCSEGGLRVEVGVDDNGDGALDRDEVDATGFVCSGAQGQPGLNALISTSTDTAGRCPDGEGVSVATGLDTDRNGVLEGSEVLRTNVVCSGVDGVVPRVEVDALPAGTECPAGGQRIRTGRDLNDNGVLDAPTEVEDDVVVCDPVANRIRLTPVASGTSTCSAGGTKLESGADIDASGTLDDAEIQVTQFVCNGDGGAASLVVVEAEPPGGQCVDGGRRIEVGLDENRNRLLDDDEVESTSYVCDGRNGRGGGAVRVTSESSGSNCSTGGTRIETGPDTNGNGALDDAEVTRTVYVCDGSGQTSLIALETFGPSADCPNGGTRVHVGLDADGSGTLDVPGEVRSTSFVCNGQAAVPFAILTDDLGSTAVGLSYDVEVEAAGGTGGGYTWSVASGQLPPGLTLPKTGTPSVRLSGTPLTSGTYDFTLRVTDFFRQSVERDYTLEVDEPPLAITRFVVPRHRAGQAYAATLTARDGTPPYAWSLIDGALPPGLTLSSTGALSGTSTSTAGSFAVIEVRDAKGETRTAHYRFPSEPVWTAIRGDLNMGQVGEVVAVRIQGSAVGSRYTLNPAPVSGGDVGFGAAPSLRSVEWSRDGAKLSLFGDLDLDGSTELWWVDMAGSVPSVPRKANPPYTSTLTDVSSHRWSPDGRWLAYTADERINGELDLYVVDTSRANPTSQQVNLSTLRVISSAFAFSPDGTMVAFEARKGTSTTDPRNLHVARLTSTGPGTAHDITSLPTMRSVTGFTWSKDSQTLFYRADADTDERFEHHMVDVSAVATGGTPSAPMVLSGPLVSGGDVASDEELFIESPDGRRVAYVADADFDGVDAAYVVDVDEPGNARIVSQPGLKDTAKVVSGIHWAPDSRRLVFEGSTRISGQVEIFVVDVESASSGPVRLNDDFIALGDVSSAVGSVQLAPNGQGVFYRADPVSDQEFDLYYAPFDAPGSPTLISTNTVPGSDVNDFSISQDGGYVLYNADPTAGVDELFLVEVDAGAFSTPVRVSSAKHSSADVHDLSAVSGVGSYFVGDAEGICFRGDLDRADVDETYFVPLTAGVAGSQTKLNDVLPSGGEVSGFSAQPE